MEARSILLSAVVFATFVAVRAEAQLSPVFRARSGENADGPMRTVGIQPPKGWRQIAVINQDPLSLGQWAPKEPSCATGAASRISVYAVDVGNAGPQKLLQKWLPSALKFNVGQTERGFAFVRAEAEPGSAQTVVAYPVSDQHVTPLAGWIGGVKILFIAESTTESTIELEELLRKTIRGQTPVKGAKVQSADVPFVLFGKKWHKSLSDRLEAAAKANKPNALVSKAYAIFADAGGFVPAGQNLLVKAAQNGHDLAKLDLIRLSRRSLLTADLSKETIDQWSEELGQKGSEDAKFWATELREFDEDESKIQGLGSLRSLAVCGQPEARRQWAKKQVQSFNAKERIAGRALVLSLMNQPPLEGTLPMTARVPRASEAPAVEQLKAAAMLKTACPNEDDPDENLFVKKRDFKVEKTFAASQVAKAKALAPAEVEEFPELREAHALDKLANGGSRAKLKEALKLACKWSGGEEDREQLVIELAARRDGLGKWRRFRACEVIRENKMALVCRDKEIKQGNLNLNTRFNDILIASGLSSEEAPAIVVAAQGLREKANAFFDKLLEKSYEQATTVREKKELDETRRQMEYEFMALLGATLNKDEGMSLASQIGDVITGRRLLVLPPDTEEASFSLKRQAPSAKFMKKEQERLEARLKETLESIEQADREDLSTEFKAGLSAAHVAWNEYRSAYGDFVKKISETHPHAVNQQMAAGLWFHIEGVYYLEKIRDRQISRVVPDIERDVDRGLSSEEDEED